MKRSILVDCGDDPAAVPVIVTEIGLAAPVRLVVALAENVTVLVVVLTDVNEAVTPVGKPVAE